MKRPSPFPFIRALAHRNRVRHFTVRAVFDSIADEVRAAVLERGERVVVPGLGVFYPKTQKAKRVLFPGASELSTIPPRVAVGFRASSSCKIVGTCDVRHVQTPTRQPS